MNRSQIQESNTNPDYICRGIVICKACYELEGEMCHDAKCIFCRRTMKEVAEILEKLLIRPVVDGERLRL